MTSAPVSTESFQRKPSAFQTVTSAAISSMHVLVRRPVQAKSSSSGSLSHSSICAEEIVRLGK